MSLTHSFPRRPASGRTARRRRLGQNFLRHARTAEQIIEIFAPGAEDLAVEIGPGRGALTLPLLPRVGRLLAIEMDRALAEDLAGRIPFPSRFRLLVEDALEVDLDRVAAEMGAGDGRRMRLIGNLPYSSATPLLSRLVERNDLFTDLTVMLQREVAERIVARPGEAEYGAFTIRVGLRAEARIVMRLGPGHFSPAPKVDSALVRLDLLPEATEGAAMGIHLAEAAFTFRRKMLATALRHAGLPSGTIQEAMASAGLSPRARPQDVTPGQFVRLAALLPPPGAVA